MEIESLCVSNTNGEMLTIQHGGCELTVMSIGKFHNISPMSRRDMSANDYPIEESERRYHS